MILPGGPSQHVVSLHVKEFGYRPDEPSLLTDLSLAVGEAELVGLMGPNGSGKSTLLYLASGEIMSPTVQRVLTCAEGQISFVYQDYRHTLFPWKTAKANMQLPGRLRGRQPGSLLSAVEALSSTFELGFDLDRYPFELSGGEQQKVCVVRALLEAPRLLLMDEPCSAMDYGSRLVFLRNLRTSLKEKGTACVLVSHSAEDAFVFCDRLLLLSRTGRLSDAVTNCQDPDLYTENIEKVHAHFLD